jgi:hypothetical protein
MSNHVPTFLSNTGGEIHNESNPWKLIVMWKRDFVKKSKHHLCLDQMLELEYSAVRTAFGHVLYAGVENMIAPTLVFQEEESDGKSHLSGGPPRKLTTLWSVPACSNRLLRFRGDGLHAVNYPPLQWLKDYESDDDSSHLLSPNSHQRRAVLLFNTWEKPPLYPPVGESLVVLGEKKLNKTGSSETKCRPKSLWAETRKVVPKEMNEHKDLVTLNVPLLGDFSRRACNETFLALKVDGQKATAAFVSTSFIHQVKLIQEPWRKLGDMHE